MSAKFQMCIENEDDVEFTLTATMRLRSWNSILNQVERAHLSGDAIGFRDCLRQMLSDAVKTFHAYDSGNRETEEDAA